MQQIVSAVMHKIGLVFVDMLLMYMKEYFPTEC